MTPQRIQIKFTISNPEAVDLDAFIPLFHGWIQQTKISDVLLVDVADYKHVPEGPGIILIGHQADYGIDEVGRLGLLYTRKRDMPDSFVDGLRLAIGQAVTAAQLIEAETDVRFAADVVDITIPDQLASPNTDDAFNELSNDVITVFLGALNNNESIAVERVDNDARLALQMRVTLDQSTTLDELMGRVAAVSA